MDINEIARRIRSQSETRFDVYERRAGRFQIILPILHEDGDMVDIYIEQGKDEGHIRVCDYGLSLMRLSYTLEINTTTRKRVFDSILMDNDVTNDGGNLYLECPMDTLYENILKFVGCVQKICSMQYWNRDTIRSAFYDDLRYYILDELAEFNPTRNYTPPSSSRLVKIDWMLSYNQSKIFLFGVASKEKAKNVVISMLQSEKEKLKYTGIVVYKNIKDLRKEDKIYLDDKSYRQYSGMVDFQTRVSSDIRGLMN